MTFREFTCLVRLFQTPVLRDLGWIYNDAKDRKFVPLPQFRHQLDGATPEGRVGASQTCRLWED